MNKQITCQSDLLTLTKNQLRMYLHLKGFGCLAGLGLKRADLLHNAIYVFAKYGAVKDGKKV